MVEVMLGPRSIDLPYTVRFYGVTEAMFDEIVDEDTKAELLDGVMIVHSPATMEHDDIGGFIRALTSCYADSKEAGRAYGPDSLVHLATCRLFAPDAYFLRQKRVPRRRPKQFEGAPDWLMEVLLPSNRDDDLEDKRPAYRDAKVEEIWFIDPENQQVIVDRLRKGRYTETVITSGRLESTVLKGFWLDASWLWADPLPNRMACLRQILGEE